MKITHLRTETLENPIGLGTARPRFSWRMETTRRGARQTACQVLVTRSGPPTPGAGETLWDSGRVESFQSHLVPYAGRPLASCDRAQWRVRVWDERGRLAESEPATFEIGLLEQTDWKAAWIGGDLVGGIQASIPCPSLRKSFPLDLPAATARLYITALGIYEATLNGQRVGQDVFNPGWTDYNKRIHYHAYDVTSLLNTGENVLGVVLGDGWYCGHVAWRGRQHYGDRPRLLAQLVVWHDDGTSTVIASDSGWQVAYGPLLAADLLMGETYDARLEFPGWDRPGFAAAGWRSACVFAPPAGRLVAASAPPVRPTQEVRPLSVTRVDDWPNPRWVFDLGQNMVGRVRLKVRGRAGQTIRLRHAEALISDSPFSPDGTLYTIALRSAKATDHYTCKGGGEENWEPRFTFHGFRYVEVTGCDPNPPLDMVTGVVLHSDLPWTGQFECSDPLLNRLQQNIQWSQRGNFVCLPTDCPQRDERLGWTGDILAFAPTAAFNMDVHAFLADWLRTLADEQREDGAIPPVAPDVQVTPDEGGPAWADALVSVPWDLYLAYGDSDLLAELYPACQKFVAWLVDNSPGYIRAAAGWQGFGDWLSTAETPKTLIAAAYLARTVNIMARIAEALDRPEDATRYQDLFEQIRTSYIQHFILPGGHVLNNTQTGYVLSLTLNLLPEELRVMAAANLANGILENNTKLTTGFVGTPHLLKALSDNGYTDLAYDLLLQKEYPSWLYPVTQGATTIWERWDGWRHDRGFQNWMMNSFNHYAYGAVGNWMCTIIAGIQPDPDAPGFQHFFLSPQPGGGLTYARAEHECPYGKIISAWRIEAGEFVWQVVIPANTSATLVVPGDCEQASPVHMEAGVYELRSVLFEEL